MTTRIMKPMTKTGTILILTTALLWLFSTLVAAAGPTQATASDLIITEIMYDPASEETLWEWIEIYNTGATTLDLSGLIVDDIDGSFHISPNISSGSVGAGQSAILYSSELTETEFVDAWGPGINLITVSNWISMGLGNGGDSIGIWDDYATYALDYNAHVSTSVGLKYDDGNGEDETWPTKSNGTSIYLTDLALDYKDGASWAISVDEENTPVFETYASLQSETNRGNEIGSPGPNATSSDVSVETTGPAYLVDQTMESIVYTVTMRNKGNQPATNVSLTNTLPGRTTYISHTSTVPETSIDDSVRRFSWDFPAVAPGETFTAVFTISVNEFFPEFAKLSNNVFITGTMSRDNERNNSASTSVQFINLITPTLQAEPRRIGTFAGSGAEITAFDPTSQKLFVVTGGDTLDIVDLSKPYAPTTTAQIDLSPYGAGANSVAIYDGLVAVAVEAAVAQDNGQIVFFDTDGNEQKTVTVGALPDMVTFTPDGSKLLVANEGEPSDDYTVDPEGSVSLIDLSNGLINAVALTIGFTDYTTDTISPDVRIFGPNATVAQDLEPEYITVSPDGTTAFVGLQENNAMAVIDLFTNSIEQILPFGFKDHNLEGNELDPSDSDGRLQFGNWDTLGMYQPDGIASFEVDGQLYVISANEGDARDYAGYSEEVRVQELLLDPTTYPDAADIQKTSKLGRLKTTLATGDDDGDGDIDQIYSYGTRSFSIWNGTTGAQVYDSGNELEKIVSGLHADLFNQDNGEFDGRSDDKGPEPEGVTIGVIEGITYAFIGLERTNEVLVFDLTDPTAPVFVDALLAEENGDVSPEGLTFITAEDSPNGRHLLVVAYEVSGTLAVFEIDSLDNRAKIGYMSFIQTP